MADTQNVQTGDPRNPTIAGRVSVWHRIKGSTAAADWKEFGNIIDPNIAAELERLAHFSTRRGTRSKDRELVTSRSARLTFKIDEINLQNLQFAFGSKANPATDTVDISEGKIFPNPGNGLTINLGEVDIKNVIVRSVSLDGAVTTYVSPADYSVVLATGIITIAGGALANAGTVPEVHVYFEKNVDSKSFEGLDGSEIEGELKFQCLPPEGTQWVAVCKNVSVRQTDSIGIGDGASWQEMEITIEILEDVNGKMVTIHVIKTGEVTS
jgi:hypothetical protein